MAKQEQFRVNEQPRDEELQITPAPETQEPTQLAWWKKPKQKKAEWIKNILY